MSEQMSLETYKREVENYLTKTLKVSTEVAKQWMTEYEDSFQAFVDEKYTVITTATAILHNF